MSDDGAGVVEAGDDAVLADDVFAAGVGVFAAAGDAELGGASFSPPVFSLPVGGFSFSE
ncbi:hypothetical protein [Petrachloros mirabilis]